MSTSQHETIRTRELTVLDLTTIRLSSVPGLLSRLVPSLRRLDARVLAAVMVALAMEPTLKAFRGETRQR